ncbi:Crp/Fnr family transcriptional regulator [Janibacter sp. GXQ6167]|uniref:Crp/Fnr family transcriptional regulator n=1 Tax=Janibacter sp. GXQ6167 TaxID=3240791 RepID=UPI0035231A37
MSDVELIAESDPQVQATARELARWALFSSVPRHLLRELAANADVLRIERGEVLFTRGTPATAFYGLVRGLIQLGVSNADGNVRVLEIIGPGQTFGEAVMFQQGGYPVNAVALAPSELVRIPAAAVDALLTSDPRFARAMLASMSMRLHGLVRDIELFTLTSTTQRVVGYLLGELTVGAAPTPTSSPSTTPKGAKGAARVDLSPSKQVVASRLGMTPESFSRVIRDLSERDLIAVRGRVVTIPDEAALLAHATRRT